jgi:long-chain fatty acid transport protein
MTLLDRTQLLGAAGALLPSVNFDVAPQTTTKGTGGGNAGVFMPLGAFFFVYKFSDRIRLGLANYSDYRLAGNYGNAWVGRYYISRAALFSGKLALLVAYKVTDWLSVGAGFSFAVARLTFQSRINNVLPRLGDGRMALESWDEAFGGHAGVLLTPIPKLRVGLTYQSPEDFKFGFKPFLTGLGPGFSFISKRIGGVQINVPLTEPQQGMASAVYEIIPSWSLMGNVGWQNWSAFGQFPVGISAKNQTSIEANLHFSDTFQLAIGQQYRIAEKWLWSAGFAYDSSPVSQANRNAVLPIDRQLRCRTGVQYEITRDVTAGAAWEFMDAGPGPFSNTRGPLAGTLRGHFSTNYLNFVALNVAWKF